MDADNPDPVANASQTNATSRAKKRRRGSSPQDETVGEGSHSKRKPTRSSQPTAQLFPPSLLLPPSQPGGGTVYSALGPISIVQHPYASTIHQPLFPPPSVGWPPVPTTPATVHGGIPTRTEQTRGPVTSPLVNDDLASVGFEGLPEGTTSSVDSPSGSQPHPNSGAANSRPRLEDLPDPPATQRPSQTLRVLANAALQSEPTGKLTLEEMVDRICSRFEYFQDLQQRTKLKVGPTPPRRDMMLIEMTEKYETFVIYICRI